MSDNESIVKFVCTKCGGETFKADNEVKTLEDFIGATCSNCGTRLTEDEIKAQGLRIAKDAARRVFGKDGKITIRL